MITKARLHIILATIFSLTAIEMGGAFLLFRKDFPQNEAICETATVLNSTGIYTIILLNCLLFTVTIIISCIWVTVRLQKRKIEMKLHANSKVLNDLCINSKLNKALLITLVVYMSLFIPVSVTFCLRIFLGSRVTLIVMNIAMLLFFMNNVVNPFIYCLTLKDFRQGYKNILLCKKAEEEHNQEIELNVIEC